MKLLGAVMVFLTCGLLGMILSRNLSLRQETLRELQVALQFLETEVAFAATPLPEAFRRIVDKTRAPTRRLFLAAGSALTDVGGITAAEAWSAGVKVLSQASPLEREDVAVLNDFGQGLGGGDRADQVKKLELARVQLKKLEEAAAENRARQAKIFQMLGFLGGLTVILLLY